MQRLMLVTAMVLAMALPASAQEFTVADVVVPQLQRQGTFQSGSVPVTTITPQLQPDGSQLRLVRVRLDFQPQDWLDPTLSAWFRLFRSADDGATWHMIGGARWQGQVGGYVGDDGTVNPMPTMTQDVTEFVGQLLRVEIDVPARMRVGATIQY